MLQASTASINANVASTLLQYLRNLREDSEIVGNHIKNILNSNNQIEAWTGLVLRYVAANTSDRGAQAKFGYISCLEESISSQLGNYHSDRKMKLGKRSGKRQKLYLAVLLLSACTILYLYFSLAYGNGTVSAAIK